MTSCATEMRRARSSNGGGRDRTLMCNSRNQSRPSCSLSMDDLDLYKEQTEELNTAKKRQTRKELGKRAPGWWCANRCLACGSDKGSPTAPPHLSQCFVNARRVDRESAQRRRSGMPREKVPSAMPLLANRVFPGLGKSTVCTPWFNRFGAPST